MKIFVSWSGELSHKVALFLKEWLPNVIQTVDLYVSSEDIDKGARWFVEVGSELEDAQFGIVCLTQENMSAPWVLFEAGAISKTVSQSRVIPLLIDLSPSNLKGPLVQFQATAITESDIRRLVKTINSSCEMPLKDTQFDRVFNKWWPELEQFLDKVASTLDQEGEKEKHRSERELLEEVLQHIRAIARTIPEPEKKPTSKVPKTAYAPSVVVDKMKRGLEDKVKPLLAMALEGAQRITVEDDELYIEFSPENRHLRATLSKPDNMRMLRDVCCEVTGRNMGVTLATREALDTPEELKAQRLREAAEQHPVVQKVLKTFRAEIVNVQGKDGEESRLSDESFDA